MSTALVSISAITAVMIVGLVFFIRASVKDRIEQLSFALNEPEGDFLPKLANHLTSRSYRLVDVNEEAGVTYEGLVSPSWFMAVFLTNLAAGGLLCLGLMLSFWIPAVGNLFLGLVLLAPLAGYYYWEKSGRLEQVKLKLAKVDQQTVLTVTGHRDELSVLEKNLHLQSIDNPE